VTAGVAAGALMAAVARVLLAVVAAVLLALGDRAVATHHRTLLLIGHGQSPRLSSHIVSHIMEGAYPHPAEMRTFENQSQIEVLQAVSARSAA